VAGLTDVPVLVISPPDGLDSYEAWRDAADGPVPGRRHPVICITYTSGSTGGPKGVMIRHEAATTFLPAASRSWGFDADAVGLVPIPLFHIGGISWLMSCLINGGSAVLLRRPDADGIMQAVEQCGGTHINVVPAILQSMLQVQRERPRNIATLRTVTCGGAPIPEAYLREAFTEFRCRVIAFYGLTEAGGGVSHHELLPGHLEGRNTERLLSAGRALDGITVTIRDLATGADLPAGSTGEIVVSTPAAMAGYWDEPDQSRRAHDAQGRLCTGDVGYLDHDGYLYVRGRIKDVIISGGENIYAAELENVIAQCPGVQEACVVASPHERWGETPVAVVVREASSVLEAGTIIDWCRSRLAHYKCPTRAVIVPEIPRTGTGKYAKNEIRAALSQPS
jgi:acyl-CoA synthetase (AMP-forming)/AMP-acid ligase II